jgi:hypothetical protein
MKNLARLMLRASCVLALILPISGCAALIPLIPQIVSVVTDALCVLGIIDKAVAEYWRTHPATDPVVVAKYNELYQKALAALNAAQKSLRGATELDQKEYDKAFADFKAAYAELQQLLRKQGVMQGNYLSVGAGQAPVYIPDPEAITFQVAKK